MQRLAIFGGTFNPIHWGHLLLAETALNQCAIDRVLWVPSRLPPHKPGSLLDFEQRLELIKRAIADHPAFSVSDIEATRSGYSYAIATLTDLQTQYSDAQWYWIIGADAFETLSQWRNSQDLIKQCIWLIAPRASTNQPLKTALPSQTAARSHLLTMPTIDLSSSLIRQRCREGQSIRYLVPESVRAYILAHQLYQKQDF